jgi:hypothetical protein
MLNRLGWPKCIVLNRKVCVNLFLPKLQATKSCSAQVLLLKRWKAYVHRPSHLVWNLTIPQYHEALSLSATSTSVERHYTLGPTIHTVKLTLPGCQSVASNSSNLDMHTNDPKATTSFASALHDAQDAAEAVSCYAFTLRSSTMNHSAQSSPGSRFEEALAFLRVGSTTKSLPQRASQGDCLRAATRAF